MRRAEATHYKGHARASYYPNAQRVLVLAMSLDGEKSLVVPIHVDNAKPRWVTTERLGKIAVMENGKEELSS